ncbi:LOW QUALITY PROTEIN: tetraspanin-19 [Phaethornis superciliosus]
MNMKDKIVMQKYYLNVFNIFLALCRMLLTFGSWLLLDRKNLFSGLFSAGNNQLVTYMSCILLGTGSANFTSAVGFLGSAMEVKCRLATVHNQWNNRTEEVISEYGNESLAEQKPVWNILNAVQHNFELFVHMRPMAVKTQVGLGRLSKDLLLRVGYVCKYDIRIDKGIAKSFQNLVLFAYHERCYMHNLCFLEICSSLLAYGCEDYLNTWFENNVFILTAITITC